MGEIELDDRKRAPLAKVLRREYPPGSRFRAERLEDGTIILTPIVPIASAIKEETPE